MTFKCRLGSGLQSHFPARCSPSRCFLAAYGQLCAACATSRAPGFSPAPAKGLAVPFVQAELPCGPVVSRPGSVSDHPACSGQRMEDARSALLATRVQRWPKEESLLFDIAGSRPHEELNVRAGVGPVRGPGCSSHGDRPQGSGPAPGISRDLVEVTRVMRTLKMSQAERPRRLCSNLSKSGCEPHSGKGHMGRGLCL